MFAPAHNAAKDIIQGCSVLGRDDLPIIPEHSLPESYSLSQLYAELSGTDAPESQEKVLQVILVLSSCVEHSTRLSRDTRDDAHVTQILLWLSKAILPSSSIFAARDGASESQASSREKELQIARQKGITGLSCLHGLLGLYNTTPAIIEPHIILSIVAFSSTRDPWTSPNLRTVSSLLSSHTHQAHASTFIIDFVLQKFIRPLFSKSKLDAITASGRKAMPSSAPPRRFDVNDFDEKNKPWMFEIPYAISVLEWAVTNSSTEIANSHFNLYIPPLLTLLDSNQTPTRSRGLQMLATLLPLLSPKLLTQTGLAEVFEDAITPTLMFLPNLTPVDESVELLEPAYRALITLGSALYVGLEVEEKNLKFWDRVMRKGILMGYAHSNEHPAVVEVLVRYMGEVTSKMRIHAVKHLKDILPILSTILSDPFASSRPSLLIASLKTLQVTVLNTWPRTSEPQHRIEIIRALAFSWNIVSESISARSATQGAEWMDLVKRELQITGGLLVCAAKGRELDIEREIEPLLALDPSFRELFKQG